MTSSIHAGTSRADQRPRPGGADIVVLIVAAGKGMRLGGKTPKQYLQVGGLSLLAHAVDHFPGLPVFLVIAEGEAERARQALQGRRVAAMVTGGKERQDSVRAGLAAVGAAGGARAILIHDAARPFVPADVIARLHEALNDHDGAVPALRVTDTVARMAGDATLGEAVDRSNLLRIQTPQAFSYDKICQALSAWPQDQATTDEAGVARAMGLRIAMVEGSPLLDKITTAADLESARTRYAAPPLQSQNSQSESTGYNFWISRTATGYDVHRLQDGGRFWLGGVAIMEGLSLVGHSDADVALHALTDALLGTIADGDIGSHFPPTDPQWRGAQSHRFLTHARDLVHEGGGIIDFVDITVICERPKIGPHRKSIRARIAELLCLDITQVSLKATTTERLGFTGRGEGVAALASATVRLPGAKPSTT